MKQKALTERVDVLERQLPPEPAESFTEQVERFLQSLSFEEADFVKCIMERLHAGVDVHDLPAGDADRLSELWIRANLKFG